MSQISNSTKRRPRTYKMKLPNKQLEILAKQRMTTYLDRIGKKKEQWLLKHQRRNKGRRNLQMKLIIPYKKIRMRMN